MVSSRVVSRWPSHFVSEDFQVEVRLGPDCWWLIAGCLWLPNGCTNGSHINHYSLSFYARTHCTLLFSNVTQLMPFDCNFLFETNYFKSPQLKNISFSIFHFIFSFSVYTCSCHPLHTGIQSQGYFTFWPSLRTVQNVRAFVGVSYWLKSISSSNTLWVWFFAVRKLSSKQLHVIRWNERKPAGKIVHTWLLLQVDIVTLPIRDQFSSPLRVETASYQLCSNFTLVFAIFCSQGFKGQHECFLSLRQGRF